MNKVKLEGEAKITLINKFDLRCKGLNKQFGFTLFQKSKTVILLAEFCKDFAEYTFECYSFYVVQNCRDFKCRKALRFS